MATVSHLKVINNSVKSCSQESGVKKALLKTVGSEKATLRITFPHSVFSSSPVTKGVRRTVAVSPSGQVVFWIVLNSG